MAQLDLALQRFPADADLRLNRAMVLRAAGKLPAALIELDAALAIDPYFFLALLSKGAVLERAAAWAKHMGKMLSGDKSGLPPVGKYNYAQKLTFWVMALSLVVLLVTGVMFWRPWFAPYFSVEAMRAAVLLHSISAVVLILSTIMHVYAAIWVKGTIRAMTRGTVTESWAKANHPLWHQEVTKGR